MPEQSVRLLADGNILHIVVIAIFAALASRGLPTAQRGACWTDGAEAGNALLMRPARG
jgi:Na+/H+-dicarboxylate symporter